MMSSKRDEDSAMSSPTNPRPEAHGRRSLLTELLLGQLAVLLLVVVGFGSAIYGLAWHSIYREVESDLLGAAQLLERTLREGGELSLETLGPTYWHRFGPAPRDQAYFVVWDSLGEAITRSDRLPEDVEPLERLPPASGPRPFVTRTKPGRIELILRGPQDEQILIGRPLGKENDHLRTLLFRVCLVGTLAIAIGCGAAWWLTRRIVRPLALLTQTAEHITARRLEQRLSLQSSSQELTRLALVFNNMLDRLQASFQAQVRFTADASHELRTPVAVILAQAGHTLARTRTEAEYRQSLHTCQEAARRMKALVDALLLLARADSGQLKPPLIQCDLATIAEEVLAGIQPLAAEQQVQLTSDLRSTPLVGDPTQLAQLVTNLVTNALKYNRLNGEASVLVHSEESQAVLVVRDTGIGISEVDQRRMFERFFQADAVRTHQQGQGFGMGLSIVDEIVAAHGGCIEVVSELDLGTQISIRLPRSGPTATVS